MSNSEVQPTLWDEPELIDTFALAAQSQCDDVVVTDAETDDARHDESDLINASQENATDDFLVIEKTDLTSVEIRRSGRRKKSAAAFRENGKTIVVVPTRMSNRDVDEFVRDLVGRLDARDQKTASLDGLQRRAAQLVKRYLDRDVISQHHVPVTIRWVTNQNSRWGSCTPADGNIRLSHRLRDMPSYVIDCVLLHELIHLDVPDHSERFYSFMNRFEELDRATAFLAGYAHAEQFKN